MKSLLNLDYTGRGAAEQTLDVFLPETEGFDTVICFHGGGFQKGDKGQVQMQFAEAFTNAGVALVSPEYRMMPESFREFSAARPFQYHE